MFSISRICDIRCLILAGVWLASYAQAQDHLNSPFANTSRCHGAITAWKLHLNLATQGTTGREGALLPTARQTHLTMSRPLALRPISRSGSCFSTPGSRAILRSSLVGGFCAFLRTRILAPAGAPWIVADSHFKDTLRKRIRAVSNCVRSWTVSSSDANCFQSGS